MTTKDIDGMLYALSAATRELEETYTETGGEVTPETEALENKLAAVNELLTTEGVDSLGRWLKAKQDEIAAAKAEKAAADARLKSLQKTEDYIKWKIAEVLRQTGTEKVKGTYYSFAQAVAVKSTVKTDALNDAYLNLARVAAHAHGLPDWCDVTLKTTTTEIKESGDPDAAAFMQIDETPSVRFTKPRAVKE